MAVTFHSVVEYGAHATSTDSKNGTWVYSEFHVAVNGSAPVPPPFTTSTLTASVGSVVNLYVGVVARSEQGFIPPADLTSFYSVKVEIPGQQLVSADPTKTSYSRNLGQYTLVPSVTTTSFVAGLWDPANPAGQNSDGSNYGPPDSVYVSKMGTDTDLNGSGFSSDFDVAYLSFYVGNYVGNFQIKITANYTRPGTFVDTVLFNLDVLSPSTNQSGTNLSITHETGASQFQFGPWYVGPTDDNGVLVPGSIQNNPLSWNDIGFWLGSENKRYVFGCQAGGVNPYQISGNIINNTPSTGTAYCVNLKRELGPTEFAYANTGANVHKATVNFLLGVGFPWDRYYFTPPAPSDAAGNTLYGCDTLSGGTTAHPWAMQVDAFTVPTPNGASVPVPPTSSMSDINSSLQSFYSGNWGSVDSIPELSIPLNIIRMELQAIVYMEFNFDADFNTYLVWEPDGGIPIGMALIPWSLRCNVYNATADGNLSGSAGRTIQANWNPSNGTSYYFGPGTFGPYYLQWSYFSGDYSSFEEVNKRRKSFSTFFSSVGTTTFGGASVMVAANGPGLPNGSSANVGGANVFGMN